MWGTEKGGLLVSVQDGDLPSGQSDPDPFLRNFLPLDL